MSASSTRAAGGSLHPVPVGGTPSPTVRLVLLLLAPLPILLLAPAEPAVVPAVLAVDGLLLLLATADWRTARRHPLEVGRSLPRHLSIGAPNPVAIRLRNRGPSVLRATVWDHRPPTFEIDRDVVSLRAEAFAAAAARVRVTPPSRGRYTFGALHIRVVGPLGLCAADRRVEAEETVRVYPDLRGAGRLLLAGGARDLTHLGIRRLRREGEGGELSALREYAPGDPYRDIDWKATARRDEPVVRVREPERSQTVLICVDAGRLMAARTGALSKLDHAVNAALLLAFVALRCDDRVGLLLFADEVQAWVPPGKGRRQYRRILDALYAAEASLTYVDYRELVRTVLSRQSRRSLVVTLTDLYDESHSRPLVRQMRRLAARHLPVVVALRDPVLEATARTAPEEAEDPWRMAVASELLVERTALKRGLATAGARILDQLPDEATLAAVNAYVEIKRRQAL